MRLLPLPLLLLLVLAISPGTVLGFYFIKPVSSPSNCLTVPGNSKADETELVVAACVAGSNWQEFEQLNGRSLIQMNTAYGNPSSCSPKCLDVVGGTMNEAHVTQQNCDPSRKSQYWVQTPAPPLGLAQPGYQWYQNLASGRCLTAESLGGYIDQYDCSTGAFHQLWSVSETDDSAGGATFTSQNPLIGCLQVTGANPNVGSEMSASLCSTGMFSQRFPYWNNTGYLLKSIGSGKCVDGGGGPSQTYQYSCVTTAQNQWWLIFTYPSEGYQLYSYFMDVMSGLCLTYDTADLTNVHTEACVQGNVKQQWIQRALTPF